MSRFEVYVIRTGGPLLDLDACLQTEDRGRAIAHALEAVRASAVDVVAVVYDTRNRSACYVASPGQGGIV